MALDEKVSNIVYISISKNDFGQRFKAMRMATVMKLIPVYPNVAADFAQVTRITNDKEARDKERLGQIKKASEVWVIGEMNREMLEDVDLARRMNKKVKYFEPTAKDAELKEIDASQAKKARFM
ncbi:MAG: hypothetical protein NTU57_03085 [Candidatus Aenigmarchaeota archaeon]|nr:hypothetical protein [Candidatus Aenigmarchaeota archaeon]